MDQQRDLTLLRVRGKLVGVRTTLINTVRGTVKSFGHRLPKGVAQSFVNRCSQELPEYLCEILRPLFELFAAATAQIAAYDKAFEQLAQQKYPKTTVLRTVPGVGPICS